MVVIRAFCLLLLFSSVVRGQAEAVIDGPDEALAGDLVVFNSVASKGHATEWIIPSALDGKWLSTGTQLAFATRAGGEYAISLVAVEVTGEDSADIDVASHVVVISGELCEPDDPPTNPDPDPPIDPEPEPSPQLRSVSRDGAVRLSDPATARALVAALGSIGQQSSLEGLVAASVQKTEAVLLDRKGESRNKDWRGQWRKPVNDATTSTTLEGRQADLAAVIAGLRDSLSTSPPATDPEPGPTVTVKVYQRPGCKYCGDWLRDVAPTLSSWGWRIETVTSSGSVPQFDVISPTGSTTRLRGFQRASVFERFRS